jgi:catechol 2,3-dioxygenase-like lactoylglutathione lyase family enzyme
VSTLGAAIAFAPSMDLDRSREFYEGVLGLTVLEQTPFAVVLAGIRVTKVEQLTPQPFTVLGWTVEDMAATVAALTAKGVAFRRFEGMDQDAAGVWTTPGGDLVAWFTDPDGNTLSLTQFRPASGP